MAWLSGWSKRKVITLTGGADGSLVDFQLKLAIAYDSDMLSDFNDLRFTDADGETLIDAWLEDKTDGVSADVWVEFPSTPADGVEEIKGYVYYGKADAVSDWDIGATGLFGDDFSVDLSKWSGDTEYGSISSGILTLDGGGDWRKIFGDVSVTPDMAMRCRANLSTFTDDGQGIGFEKIPCCDGRSIIYNTGLITNDDDGNSEETSGLLNANTWYVFDILQISGTSVELLADGVSKVTHTAHVGTIAEPANIASRNGKIDVDWVFVRKYAANPPTYEFGSEENAPTGLTILDFERAIMRGAFRGIMRGVA